VSKLVYTICKKCGIISNALFSGICDECFWKQRRQEKIIKLNLCKVCGKQSFLIAKRCKECNKEYMKICGERKPHTKRKIHKGIRPDKKLLESPHTRQQYFKEKYG
jgi:NMD protein affecting ribosome stability and mRNA decay